MKTLTEEQATTEWVNFYEILKRANLDGYYDADTLKEEMINAPCALNEESGTSYKGALLVHINMLCALAQRTSKMVSGTFQIDEASLFRTCIIMHLAKRHLYVPNENQWEIDNRGINFKFNKELEGCLKCGERGALEALNNGAKLTPIEFEAIKSLDDIDNTDKRAFGSILTTIVRTSNELAYAIAKERYKKSKAE